MICYDSIHIALQKMKLNEELTQADKCELVKLIQNALGKWIPTIEEMSNYKQNVELILVYQKSIKTIDLIPALLQENEAYDSKYYGED